MEDRYLKKENETDFEHGLRLIEIKCEENPSDLDWQDMVDILKLNIHRDSLRKVGNTTEFSAYNVMKYYKEKQIDDITDEKVLNKIDLKKLELEKERKKIQTQKLEVNRGLRETARIELYLEQLDESVKAMKPLEIPEFQDNYYQNEKQGLVCITDEHFSKEIEIRGIDGKIINRYNEQIFKNRMWNLLNQTKNIIAKEQLGKVSVVNLSDCIDGILRISQLQSLQYGIIDSVIRFSEFMANWLNELSRFVKIDYYQCWGNHDELRILDGKKGSFPNENVNRLIMEFIELRLKDNPNVIIHNDNRPFIYFTIFGTKIFGIHGEFRNLSNTLKDLQMLYDIKIDLLLAGHLHKSQVESIGMGAYGDIETIRIPSLCGADDFSMSLLKANHAGAKMIIIEDDIGKSITYDIYLNDIE